MGGGFKDGERRGDNSGDREEVADSDDDDSEFLKSLCWCLFIYMEMKTHRSRKKNTVSAKT